jgi:hypothetical protein
MNPLSPRKVLEMSSAACGDERNLDETNSPLLLREAIRAIFLRAMGKWQLS